MRGEREEGDAKLTSQAKYMMIIEAVWSEQARKELLIFRFEAWFFSECYLQVCKCNSESESEEEKDMMN